MVAVPAFSIVFLFILVIWVGALVGLGFGIAALISVANTPTEAFGPWWDNTRQQWLVGIAIGFVIPFGTLITGIMWFSSGRAPLRAGYGVAGRPFWAGPPKPPPGPPPPGWPGYPPSTYGPGAPPPPAG